MGDVTVHRGYMDTGLGQVHYREAGLGEPLILLHPAPRSSLVFGRLLVALAERRGLRAIALDLPGFGLSDDLPEGTTIARIASTVAQFIESLGFCKAHVFGLHSGNKVAAALTAEHPKRVDRLVLAGMTHSIILDTARRNDAMREYVKHKPPTSPAADRAAWHDEQVDRLFCRGYEAMYAANFAFDLAAACARIANRALVLELEVPQEASLGRQADGLCRAMGNAQPSAMTCDDREFLQERAVEAAGMLALFYLEA